MRKAVSFSLGLFFLLAMSPASRAQTTATDDAVEHAILNQHNTIVLRQKLVEAHGAVVNGDLVGAAKLYEDAKALVDQIGSGIEAETAQTISGLVAVRMELARNAQRNGDYQEADTEITRVLKVDPTNPDAQAFKRDNDAIIASLKGKIPDAATQAKVPAVIADKTQAGTYVQNGKLLYEMGKFEESEVQLNNALKLDPDNQAAFYYLNLVKQAFYARQEHKRVTETHDKMVEVEKQWSPKSGLTLPVPNPYATNRNVNTGAGRSIIFAKLDRLRLDTVSWPDGLPLSEALRYLNEQSKLRDPDKKGINFLFNPNQESETAPGGADAAAPTVRIDPATGAPIAGAPGGGGTEPVDPGTITVKLNLSDVSLHDAIDAIIMVADKRIRYSVEEWGVVFAVKPAGPEPPQLEMRVFKVDPNTFYQGLQSVTSFTFGSANNNSGGGGNGGGGNGGGGNGGGGNGGGGNGGGGNGNSVSGAIVPIVDVTGGGGRNNGGGGGGRGNNGGGNGGAGGGAGATGGIGGGGGLSFITSVGNMQDVSVAAKTFFQAIGVDLTTPGRSLAFNDRLGLLFVKATASELDTIERTIQALNQVAPQVHVKARFIEVLQDDSAALGFDWWLGNFINGRVIANGGSAPSLTVPVSAANPLGAFPGNTVSSLIGGSSADQQITGGLRNINTTLATVTGILTDPNFRFVIHALEQRGGVETLAEPEVVTTSGRQTQMRATDIQYIVTGFNFEAGNAGLSTGNNGATQ